MNEKKVKYDYFLAEMEKLIHNNSIEDIKNFIKETEKKFDGSKINLILMKIEDSFRKEKLSKFFQLGYKNNLNIKYFEEEDYRTIRTKRQIFNCIVNNERVDVFDFLMKNKYFNKHDLQDVVELSVKSEKILKHVLNEYGNQLNESNIAKMLKESIYIDAVNNIDLLMNTPFKIYQKVELMHELGYLAIKKQSNKIVKKIFNKNFKYNYDVNFIDDENKSFFLTAVLHKNYEAVHYLTASYTLNINTNISRQFHLLKKIPHFKEIYPIINVDKELEEKLKDHNLFSEYETIVLFKNLNDSLNTKNKISRQKMKI